MVNKMIKIWNEEETDYERVEEITRKAFWNLYIPGCIEHYLVYVMRSHKDFLTALDLVLKLIIRSSGISCTQKQNWLMSLGNRQ